MTEINCNTDEYSDEVVDAKYNSNSWEWTSDLFARLESERRLADVFDNSHEDLLLIERYGDDEDDDYDDVVQSLSAEYTFLHKPTNRFVIVYTDDFGLFEFAEEVFPATKIVFSNEGDENRLDPEELQDYLSEILDG